jgi:hypothetical protein
LRAKTIVAIYPVLNQPFTGRSELVRQYCLIGCRNQFENIVDLIRRSWKMHGACSNEKVDPNTRDEEGLTILSSISQLFFDCDFDELDWSVAIQEERETLELLRQHGAKMSKELTT